MKVVLIDEVDKLGIAGDIRDVKDGYGRNFLIPKRLAVLASAQALAGAGSKRKTEVERRTKLNMEMESVGERLSEERLLIAVRVGPGGRLYGSVTTTEIADAVNEAMGVDIDRRAINLPQPIRELGHHQVPVRLAPDVIPSATITVYAEGTDPPSRVEATTESPDDAEEATEDAAAMYSQQDAPMGSDMEAEAESAEVDAEADSADEDES